MAPDRVPDLLAEIDPGIREIVRIMRETPECAGVAHKQSTGSVNPEVAGYGESKAQGTEPESRIRPEASPTIQPPAPTPSPSRTGERLPDELIEARNRLVEKLRDLRGGIPARQDEVDLAIAALDIAITKNMSALRTAEQERDRLAQRNATQALTIHNKREAWFVEQQRANELQAQLTAHDQTIAQLREALVKVRAHTSYTSPGNVVDKMELLAGLLASIERIVEVALTPPAEGPRT